MAEGTRIASLQAKNLGRGESPSARIQRHDGVCRKVNSKSQSTSRLRPWSFTIHASVGERIREVSNSESLSVACLRSRPHGVRRIGGGHCSIAEYLSGLGAPKSVTPYPLDLHGLSCPDSWINKVYYGVCGTLPEYSDRLQYKL